MTYVQEQHGSWKQLKKIIPLTREALYAEQNKAFWRDHCFRGKAICITNSVCVFGFNCPTREAHVSWYFVIFSQAFSTINLI
jgi:hypothetical protein